MTSPAVDALLRAAADAGELYVLEPEVPEEVYPGITDATAGGLLRRLGGGNPDFIDYWVLTDAGRETIGLPKASSGGFFSALRSFFARSVDVSTAG